MPAKPFPPPGATGQHKPLIACVHPTASCFGLLPGFPSSFLVFDHIDESFFYFNRSLQLQYINKAGNDILERAYGFRIKVGETIVERLPAERQPVFTALMNRVLDGEVIDYELELPSRRMWIHCRYFPCYAADGNVVGFYGVTKDITASKEVGRLAQEAQSIQQDLFTSRLLFEQFMQNSPLTAWLTDARGVLHYMNPVYLTTYGFTPADFGRSIYELFPAQVAIDYHMNNHHVIKSGAALETVEKGITAEGKEQVLKIYKFPMQVAGETMVGGWAVDISDQVELQEKLIKSVERHEYVNEATSDIVYDWDFATGQFYRSNRFEEVFGYTEKTMSLRQRFKLIHPDDMERFKGTVFAALRNPSVAKWETEYRMRTRNGEYRNVQDKAFIIRTQAGVARVIGAQQDISAQKELQQKLVAQEKRAKRALIKSIIETQEKERRQLSVELHDNVNQMLASCKLMLEVARENGANAGLLTDKAYQSIQTVINEIRRISHDLNPSAIVDVGLVEAIEQLVEKINLAGKINVLFVPDRREYKHQLREEDKIAIFRIVQEQLSNILKHAGATTVVIRLEVVESEVRLWMKDDGVGFDPANQKKGLGLRNICNRVEYYNGLLDIVSEKGKGCEMFVRLKIKSRPSSAGLRVA